MSIVLFILFATNYFLSYQNDTITNIYFKELQFEINLSFLKGYPDIDYPIMVNTDNYNSKEENDSISLILYNHKGSASFRIYDSNDNCTLEGKYFQSLGVLSDYVMLYDPIEGKLDVGIRYFYQPLPDGIWVHFNENGDTVKIEEYKRGIKIINDR